MDVVEGLAHKRRLPISTLCHCSPRLITLRISPQMCTTKISLATHTHTKGIPYLLGKRPFYQSRDTLTQRAGIY